tara:strand:- start:39 stop:257 length:219 start_codon:yes stop_codon:yes gene_type:complete
MGFTKANTAKLSEVDFLSELSPVCKSIVLGRTYQSKYSKQPIKDRIKESKVTIHLTKGVVAAEPWLVFMASC